MTELPDRKCQTCGETKRATLFASSYSRRCKTCTRRASRALCVVCGEPAAQTKGRRRKPRKTCSPECLEVCRSEAIRARNEVRAAKLALRTEKRCPACARTLPLDSEHWAPGAGGALDCYCRWCRAAQQRDRYRTDPEFRAASHERAKAWHAEHGEARKDSDAPAKRVSRRSACREPAPRLAALPLARFVDGMVLRGRLEDFRGEEDVCASLGIAARQVRAWRVGEIEFAHADTVDRVIQNAGSIWWEVYDRARWPAEHEQARLFFEGPS